LWQQLPHFSEPMFCFSQCSDENAISIQGSMLWFDYETLARIECFVFSWW
jgi:hypothetical protein